MSRIGWVIVVVVIALALRLGVWRVAIPRCAVVLAGPPAPVGEPTVSCCSAIRSSQLNRPDTNLRASLGNGRGFSLGTYFACNCSASERAPRKPPSCSHSTF